jgi:hypothetical protein
MADISKRTTKARKRAAKRAKAARKAAAKTDTRTQAQVLGAFAAFLFAAIATAKLLKGRGDEARYKPQPDNLPNEPDRPAGTTPMPTATS